MSVPFAVSTLPNSGQFDHGPRKPARAVCRLPAGIKVHCADLKPVNAGRGKHLPQPQAEHNAMGEALQLIERHHDVLAGKDFAGWQPIAAHCVLRGLPG